MQWARAVHAGLAFYLGKPPFLSTRDEWPGRRPMACLLGWITEPRIAHPGAIGLTFRSTMLLELLALAVDQSVIESNAAS